MPTFDLSPEQREYRSHLRRFCDEKLAPCAAGYDEREEYPWESFNDCVAMELPALGIPVAYGGAGADLVTQAVMVEELARVCASTSVTILISKLGMIPVMNFGSEELRRRYLPRVASGEAQASYCLSEPDAGSDVASMTTRAVRDGDHYVLTGTKYWITNAGISDTYTVFAKTDPAAGHRGISCFVVEADWGVKVPKLEHKMGLRGSPTGEVVFDEVRVPAANLVGEEGQGFYVAMHTLDRSRPTIGAQAVGIAQGALDYALSYVQRREQFGHPIAEFQGLQFMLADMAMRIEAARGLVYRACTVADADDPDGELGEARRDGEVLRVRRGDAGGDRRRPAARRLRLHQGVPGGALHARRQDHPDLRGDEPGAAGRDREAPARLGIGATSGAVGGRLGEALRRLGEGGQLAGDVRAGRLVGDLGDAHLGQARQALAHLGPGARHRERRDERGRGGHRRDVPLVRLDEVALVQRQVALGRRDGVEGLAPRRPAGQRVDGLGPGALVQAVVDDGKPRPCRGDHPVRRRVLAVVEHRPDAEQGPPGRVGLGRDHGGEDPVAELGRDGEPLRAVRPDQHRDVDGSRRPEAARMEHADHPPLPHRVVAARAALGPPGRTRRRRATASAAGRGPCGP